MRGDTAGVDNDNLTVDGDPQITHCEVLAVAQADERLALSILEAVAGERDHKKIWSRYTYCIQLFNEITDRWSFEIIDLLLFPGSAELRSKMLVEAPHVGINAP